MNPARIRHFVIHKLLGTVLAVVAGLPVSNFAAGIEGRSFAPMSRPDGTTMFTELPADLTGIVTENNYADPDMWGSKFQELTLGGMGSGLTIGDYDNDGRPDLFVVSKTESCRLFRNLGNWKFEDVTEKAGLLSGAPSGWRAKIKGWMGLGSENTQDTSAWKQGATFVDVNNDGWLDIYVCRFGFPNWLYINKGDGTFSEEAESRGLGISDASGMGSFCDYDRDGWLDVYVQTNMLDAVEGPSGQRDYLFRNKGDGAFVEVTNQAGIKGETLAHSATWWDYNNDGWPDLYVANDFAAPDALYRNDRHGTFTDVINETPPRTSYSSMGADSGDVNNDGLMDFLVTDMAATTHEKDQRGMASSRELSRTSEDDTTITPQFPRNVLFLNTDTEHLLEAAFLTGIAATDWTWSVRFEDLDNDGRLDLHVTNGMNREFQNTDLRQRIILAENPAERMRLMRESPELNEPNFAFQNLGDLKFSDQSAQWGLSQSGISFGAAFGDLDGDGDLDLVYANYQRGVTVLRNDREANNSVVLDLRGTRSNRYGVGAKVRIETKDGVQVRELVLSRGYLSASEPALHFGLGDATKIDRMTVSWPSGHVQEFTGVTANQRYQITEPDAASTPSREDSPRPAGLFSEISRTANLALHAEEGARQEQTKQPLIPTRFDRRGPSIAVGDLNGDGVEDIVFGGTVRTPARILLGDGSGRFAPAANTDLSDTTDINDGPLLVFDADGDGSNDLLLTKCGTNQPPESARYQPRLFLNDGRGNLRPAADGALPPAAVSAGALAAVDFNRDGRLDVFIGGRVQPGKYPTAPRSALLVNRGGRFEDVTETIAPGLSGLGMVTSALWSDVDNDGWADLLVALEWGGVRYFRNAGGLQFEDRSSAAGFDTAGSGWWNSLAAADFNSDGKIDYAAGNVGLNTQYRASETHPALLFHGSFRGRQSQIIEAYYEGDKLYPWRTSKALGQQIPTVARNYRKNDDFAEATLQEILDEKKIAEAERFAATEFRSGVFLSQPGGTFSFHPLPRIAQIAPIQGLIAGDFDGDGHPDIYAVHNSFEPVPVVGRFDGGLSQLLRGDGHGNFVAVPVAESGLIVPGDAKALVTLDMNGDQRPDFFVSRNNTTALAFSNNADQQEKMLQVSLQGAVGNPSAIGARVTLEHADGSTRTAEVYAGSGYWSQSSPSVFFGLPADNPPRGITVRWPSGITTTHTVATGEFRVVLRGP